MKIKVVIRVTMCDPKKSRTKAMKIAATVCGFWDLSFLRPQKSLTKAMKIAATVSGLESVAIKGDDKDQIEVTGEGIDTVELAKLLRKKVGHADLLSVGPSKADKEKEKEKEKIIVDATGMPIVWSSQYPTTYYYGGGVPAYQLCHVDRDPSCSIM